MAAFVSQDDDASARNKSGAGDRPSKRHGCEQEGTWMGEDKESSSEEKCTSKE